MKTEKILYEVKVLLSDERERKPEDTRWYYSIDLLEKYIIQRTLTSKIPVSFTVEIIKE